MRQVGAQRGDGGGGGEAWSDAMGVEDEGGAVRAGAVAVGSTCRHTKGRLEWSNGGGGDGETGSTRGEVVGAGVATMVLTGRPGRHAEGR